MNIHRCAAISALLLITACQAPTQDQAQEPPAQPSPNMRYGALTFTDIPEGGAPYAAPATMALEVALDRLGFSSGVIDGKPTQFDRGALRGFQTANGLDETGDLDASTKAALGKAIQIAPTRLVRVPAEFAKGPFAPDLPRSTAEQAGHERLDYRTLLEALAERFHTTPETLTALNPANAKLGAGAVIRVPNIPDVDPADLGEDERGWNRTLMTLGISPRQPSAERLVVDKSDAVLRAYDAGGRLLAQFPATMGSEHDPLPLGEWTVQGISRNPDFHYNPKLFWDVSDAQEDKLLKPGPNGPVGVVWLDLSKEHYGIHGTAEPASIGLSQSHGCVRLTNWDAARLAQMVRAGVVAVFQE